ncbi:MAG: hypothetical protein H6974_01730 [Gammaproteobacteria bacterium]|nr:hypothetical protein [Gammaproteobacteria bacterium]MCP5195507.1 hypothetical protein [Gammaproteobacteria bacterium]
MTADFLVGGCSVSVGNGYSGFLTFRWINLVSKGKKPRSYEPPAIPCPENIAI